jgi:excisionase family DNA binding protein
LIETHVRHCLYRALLMSGEDFLIRGSGPRVVSVSEAAEMLSVDEDCVRRWIASGRLRSAPLADGQSGVQIADEAHSVCGALEQGFIVIDVTDQATDGLSSEEFDRELQTARRARQLAGLEPGDVDVEALASALAQRLAAVVPAQISVTVQAGMVWFTNEHGHGSGSDIASSASIDGSLVDRVCAAAERTLDCASDMIAEETTEPWPACAGEIRGGLPGAGAEPMGDAIRLWFGDPDAPVLELPRIRLDEVRRRRGTNH